MLPMAIDFFRRNTEATVYQMLWKSKHGTAYIQVEKGSIFMPSTWRMIPGARKRKLMQRQDEDLWSWAHVIAHFINLRPSTCKARSWIGLRKKRKRS
uniref:Uncharacterized protein n=1 Tax=Arundo donax TaxID=35708 RepID=A0A0A8YWV1_ARUDO